MQNLDTFRYSRILPGLENAVLNLAQEIQKSARPLGEEKLFYLNPTSFIAYSLTD